MRSPSNAWLKAYKNQCTYINYCYLNRHFNVAVYKSHITFKAFLFVNWVYFVLCVVRSDFPRINGASGCVRQAAKFVWLWERLSVWFCCAVYAHNKLRWVNDIPNLSYMVRNVLVIISGVDYWVGKRIFKEQ